MSWGYRHSTTSFSQEMQSGKKLVNTTELGTKIYSCIIGNGINEIKVFWHDNRGNKLNSKLILKKDGVSKLFDIPFLKTQKDIFEFAEEQLIKLHFVSST